MHVSLYKLWKVNVDGGFAEEAGTFYFKILYGCEINLCGSALFSDPLTTQLDDDIKRDF